MTVDLENKLKDANISLITSEVFQHNPAPQVLNLKVSFKSLARTQSLELPPIVCYFFCTFVYDRLTNENILTYDKCY